MPNKGRLIALAAISIALGGCSPGKRPFQTVQFYVAGPQEIDSFKAFMDSISQQYGMVFTDNSGATEAELRTIYPKGLVPHPTLNIDADRDGDFSFGVGNLGMPDGQVVVSFNGTKLDEAKQVADAVVVKLSTRWHIQEVPPVEDWVHAARPNPVRTNEGHPEGPYKLPNRPEKNNKK